MSNTISFFCNRISYLLPGSLLAVSGFLLAVLLNFPTPSSSGISQLPTMPITERAYWLMLADSIVAAIMADEKQLQQPSCQLNPYNSYIYGKNQGNPVEWAAGFRIAPLIIENPKAPVRPSLTRL